MGVGMGDDPTRAFASTLFKRVAVASCRLVLPYGAQGGIRTHKCKLLKLADIPVLLLELIC